MGLEKNNAVVIALMLSFGAGLAATSVMASDSPRASRVPTSIVQPVPMQSTSPVLALAQTSAPKISSILAPAPIHTSTLVSKPASASVVVKPVSMAAPVKPAAVIQPAVAQTPNKPAEVYADIPAGQSAATQAVPADVNTDIPYASMLPPGAEIVAGDSTKNEFFIVAAEDAAKIRHLIDHTKPGTEIAAKDVKSKQPIIKVKLDESNSTLVSMDVVASIDSVARSAMKPSVRMTESDEVLSIVTKNKITPVGSRAVVAVAIPKEKTAPDEIDEKPMLKLLAAADPSEQHAAPANAKIVAEGNPLASTTVVKSGNKTLIPDTTVAKQTIDQPVEAPVQAPVELPLASKEASPTLEMVLQQAKNGKGKVDNEAAVAFKTAVDVAEAKTKTDVSNASVKASVKKSVASKAVAKKVVATTSYPKKIAAAKAAGKKAFAVNPLLNKATAEKTVSTHASKKKLAVAGEIIPFDQIKKSAKSADRWSARHAEAQTKTKNPTSKKLAVSKKRVLNVGVVHDYADYLTSTGHRARQSTE